MKVNKNILNELATARERAEAGKAGEMETYLGSAQRYAQKVGVDVSAIVDEIRALVKK